MGAVVALDFAPMLELGWLVRKAARSKRLPSPRRGPGSTFGGGQGWPGVAQAVPLAAARRGRRGSRWLAVA